MEEDAGAEEEGEEGAGCFLSFPEAPEEEESVLPVFFFPFSLFAAGSCSEEPEAVSEEGAFPFFPLCAAVFPAFGADFAVCGAEEEEKGELPEAAAIGGAGTFSPATPEEEEREDSFLAEGEESDASPPEAGREAETDGDNDGDGEDGDGS